MNPEQDALYREWKETEQKVHWSAGTIHYNDIKRADVLRPKVWEELREHLSIAERFELGEHLGKTLKERTGKVWPPKNWLPNQILAYGAVSRAKSNLHFVETCIESFHKNSTDPVYSRSLYILLSYSAELIFESYNLLKNTKPTKEELIADIKKGHNLVVLCQPITDDKSNSLGLISCKRRETGGYIEYLILTSKGDIIIQDLKDVRYDFIFYEREGRIIQADEANRMKKELVILLEMTKKIMETLPQL